MIRDVRLVPPVVQLLHTRRVARAPQHPVAPRRDPPLLGRVVLGAVQVVLVRRRERNGALHERAQADVGLHLFRQLVVHQEALKRVLLDGRYDQVPALVDSVVQVAAHLYVGMYVVGVQSCNPGTHKDNLVVEGHGPIAATNQGKSFIICFYPGKQLVVLDDRRSIRVPVANPSVSSS